MRYLLTVLTNGRDTYLRRTLEAFNELVTPAPVETYVFDDGSASDWEMIRDLAPGPVTVEGERRRMGMCRAHRRCWHAARESGRDWVFHIEDDQVILRPTVLDELADTIDRTAAVQMALVRCPWGAEIEHGGYIPQSPGWYERKDGWISTTRNWATSPALFRTELAREVDWPTHECETAVGSPILQRHPGGVFGLWGGGEPHYAHIGVDRAVGAHGY